MEQIWGECTERRQRTEEGEGRKGGAWGRGRDGGEIKRDERGWEMKGVVVVEEEGRGVEGQSRMETERERERELMCLSGLVWCDGAGAKIDSCVCFASAEQESLSAAEEGRETCACVRVCTRKKGSARAGGRRREGWVLGLNQ